MIRSESAWDSVSPSASAPSPVIARALSLSNQLFKNTDSVMNDQLGGAAERMIYRLLATVTE